MSRDSENIQNLILASSEEVIGCIGPEFNDLDTS